MIKCPGCGAGMRFDPASQMLKCDHCYTSLDPEEYDKDPHYTQAETEAYDEHLTSQKKTYDATIFHCPNCGGELISTDETAATFCSFCGSSVLLMSRLSKQEYPTYIIPFRLTKEETEELYKKKIRRSLFVPSYMKDEAEIEKFRGIYMPYWAFEMTKSQPLYLTGKKEERRGDYRYTHHYRISKEVQGDYEGISYDAAADFSDILSQGIAPYDTKEAKPFSPAYMAGFYGDVGDVDSGVYEADAMAEAEEYFKSQALQDKAFRGIELTNLDSQIQPDSCEEKIGLMPVWFLAIKSRNQKRVSYAAVNGQNGEIAADLPVSYGKYLLASLLLSVPLFLLLNLWLTLSPMKALIANLFLSVVGLLIVNHQLNVTYTREHFLDDRGYQLVFGNAELKKQVLNAPRDHKDPVSFRGCFSTLAGFGGVSLIFIMFGLAFELIEELPQYLMETGVIVILVIGAAVLVFTAVRSLIRSLTKDRIHRKKIKFKVFPAPMAEKIGCLLKPLVGIVISMGIYLISPAADYYYYGTVMLSLLLLAWSFGDIIKQHNRQTMRVLPQFGKRGGSNAH